MMETKGLVKKKGSTGMKGRDKRRTMEGTAVREIKIEAMYRAVF